MVIGKAILIFSAKQQHISVIKKVHPQTAMSLLGFKETK
jgi:hypothetical protein